MVGRHGKKAPRVLCAALCWAGLDWAGLDWAGLGWAGLDWAGLGWAGLDWAVRGSIVFRCPAMESCRGYPERAALLCGQETLRRISPFLCLSCVCVRVRWSGVRA